MDKLYFTREGYEAMKKQAIEFERKLEDLQSQTAHVAEVGGNQYHDNSSYELLIIDIRAADYQVKQLRNNLSMAVIIDPPADIDSVRIGLWVRCLVNGSEKIFKIVGFGESDPEKGLIAYNAPLAQAIFLKEEGDFVSGKFGNKKLDIEILQIGFKEDDLC